MGRDSEEIQKRTRLLARRAKDEKLCRVISDALPAAFEKRVRERLTLVKAVLGGKPVSLVAAKAGIGKARLREWVRLARLRGVIALMTWESNSAAAAKEAAQARRTARACQRLTGDNTLSSPAALAGRFKELAESEADRRMKKRLLVLAEYAGGATIDAAAGRFKASPVSLLRWVSLFQREGFDALRVHPGRPGRLGRDHLAALEKAIAARPESTIQDLAGMLQKRFGLRIVLTNLRKTIRAELDLKRSRKSRAGVGRWVSAVDAPDKLRQAAIRERDARQAE